MPTPLSLKEQEILYKQLVEEQNRLNTFATQATPQLATRVGEIYRNNPQLPAGAVLSSAQAGLPDEQLKDIAGATALKLNQQPDALKPKKNWFQRNIYDKLKTTTRYGFAAMDLPVQTIQGAAAQIFSDSPNGIDGWFISTDLGSLIKNDEQAGDGFFLGGEAKQFQTKRVQNYRGTTTGGHAWSIGRGLAGTVLTEGSRAYNLMSGFVDGALTIAVPIAPGFKQAAGAIKVGAEAQGASDLLRGIDRTLDVVRGKGTVIKTSEMSGEELRAARVAAGILHQTVDAATANKFLGSAKGLRLIDRLVEADTADAVRKLIGDKVYPETVQRLRNAGSNAEVEEILADVLGKPKLGITRTIMPGTKRFGLSNARRVAVIDNLVGSFENTKKGRMLTRAFESRPQGTIIDFGSETPRDVGRTINDIDRWMKVSLTDQNARVNFLDRAIDAMTGPNATPSARKAIYDEFNDLIKQSWIDAGVDSDVASAVRNSFRNFTEQSRKYGASLDGQLNDGNMFMGIAQPNGQIANAVFGGPTLVSELANLSMEMPDVRQVRALTGRYNKIWRKNPKGDYVDGNIARLAEAGKLRVPFAAVVGFQEEFFKKIILATGGYTIRNLAEGQISLALSQKPVTSIFRHPLQHMQWSAHRWLGGKVGRKGIGDIRGELFDEAVKGMEDYQRATGIAVTGHYSDPSYPTKAARRSGTFEDIKRYEAPETKVVEAHGDQIGLLNADPLVRRIALGDTDDQLINYIRTNADGQKWFRDQQDYHINGRTVWNRDANNGRGGWSGKVSIDLNDEHNLRLLLDNYRARFNVNVGGHDSLRIAVSSGLLPPQTISARAFNWDASFRGTVQEIPVGTRGRTMTVRVDASDENIVRPFAFKDGESTKELQELLTRQDIYNDPNIAQVIAHEVRVPVDLGKRGFKENWDNTMDRFFGFMSRKPTAYIERAPAFKQRYYAWAIDELATSLSPADLDTLIANVTRKSADAGISPSDYVGDTADFGDMVSRLFRPSRPVVGDRWQKLLDLQTNPSRLKGTLSLDDVDEYAKGAALDDLSKMLYDSSERNNLTDVARIIMPFGQAQAEFFRRLSRIYTVETGLGVALPNLNALRKTQLIVDRGQEADPDGDGRGFFYTDPQTGEWSFDYPFSQGFTHLATSLIGGGPGVKSTLQAPVKGALMGLDIKLGFGPVVQVTASALLKDVPQVDFVKAIVLPYGEIDIKGQGGTVQALLNTAMPAWFKKIEQGFFSSPESADTFGNTYMEVYQALATTTKYDLKTDDGRDQLYQDSITKARFLTVLRGIGQFLGPSRPTNKFTVETKQGDVAVNVLSMELRKLQLEDYDSAIPRFLDTYGEDVFVYLSGKTKAVYGGLQASKQFGDFERANKGLFRKYSGVAGFFVEGGTDLDWQVYSRQLEKGERERLTPQETLEAAQKYVAYSQYRQVQDLVGPYPNAEQKQYLRDFREYLGEMYPGFTTGTFDPNKMKTQIDELTRAVNDSSLVNNDIAEAARQYLEVREAVMVEAANRGLSGIDRSKNAADLRGYLREYAVTLKTQYPDFARMYDRLLLQEVDE